MNRRLFTTHSLMTLGSVFACPWEAIGQRQEKVAGITPATLSVAPNYWCTWSMQNSIYGRGASKVDVTVLEGDEGADIARSEMNEARLFGPEGWAHVLYPEVRKELYFLLDDGWEYGGTASGILDQQKFPSFSGSPSERLRKLNERLQQSGWRGLALWLRNTPGGEDDKQLVRWSEEARVGYWKIDGGDVSLSATRARDTLRTPLTIEHVHGEPPLNGAMGSSGRFGKQPWGSPRVELVRHSDVYRVYDSTSYLSIPTILDRICELLQGAAGHSEVHCLLNAEDEAYIAAVLGCTMGIMRFPLYGARRLPSIEKRLEGPRQLNRCTEEVVRTIRWQRMAAPYPAGLGTVYTDDEILTDDWNFEHGETWFKESIGRTVRQGAPARFSRNLPLPEVSATGQKPFVFTASFPNGAAALGMHGRTSTTLGWTVPLADVVWRLENFTGPFGIFGSFKSVTLKFMTPIKGKRIIAQGLSSNRAQDITGLLHMPASDVVLPGELLSKLGREGTPPGDLSSPALIVALR